DDIIDDEDALPYDLTDSDDEDLINVDDDMLHGPTAMTVAVRIVPLHTMYPPVARVASLTENLSLKEITDKKGPVPIWFEVRDKQTLMPLDDYAAHWSSYIGETQFDLKPHMESPDWTEIDAGIQQHLQKAYNTNKAAFKAHHWVIDTQTGTYNVEKIMRARPEAMSAEEWDTQSSATQNYPSLIDTFFVAHTVNRVFTRDEDRLIHEEMRRLEATGTYTDDEINCLARRGKQRGHILGVGRVLPARVTAGPSQPAPESTLKSLHKKAGASGSGGCGDDQESADDQEDEDEDGDGDSYLCYIL
nr:hypothetical protein [Tanacetum cinerariifolium]